MASEPPPDGQVAWKDPRFAPAIDKIRLACGVADRSDDALIGMMLDRFAWDEQKVITMYEKSARRRKELGLAEIKADIQRNSPDGRGSGELRNLPHDAAVRSMITINGSTSSEKPAGRPGGEAEVTIVHGRPVHYGDVIGCYELRYGHCSKPAATAASAASEAPRPPPLSTEQFTRYMVYVTQWRWLQCERYIHRHGELGFWSIIHDVSCPAGYISLWGRMRSLLREYMPPVEEACGGLFPPMVQKILIINVPRIFGPAWSVISRLLPQHHKDRVVLLTTAHTNAAEVGKYVPAEHIPLHLREGRHDGPD